MYIMSALLERTPLPSRPIMHGSKHRNKRSNKFLDQNIIGCALAGHQSQMQWPAALGIDAQTALIPGSCSGETCFCACLVSYKTSKHLVTDHVHFVIQWILSVYLGVHMVYHIVPLIKILSIVQIQHHQPYP